MPNRMEIPRRVSLLAYVWSGLPPILTIHGDADTIVPYSHAKRLHEALGKAGVSNQLLTVPGANTAASAGTRRSGFSPRSGSSWRVTG